MPGQGGATSGPGGEGPAHGAGVPAPGSATHGAGPYGDGPSAQGGAVSQGPPAAGVPPRPETPPAPGAGPLPPQAPPGGSPWQQGAPAQGEAESTQFLGTGWVASPDAEETRMLPPQAAEPDAQATQHLPAYPANDPAAAPGGDAEATRMIPPQGAGDPESTTRLRAARPPARDTGHPGPPPGGAPYGVRTGAPADPQPPTGFESLFRDGPGTPAAPPPEDRTQTLPPMGAEGPGGGPPAGRAAARREADRERGRHGMSRGVLIAVSVAGIAIIGLITGAALSSGGGEEEPQAGGGATTAPAGERGSPSPSADAAESQARKLNALLESSNNSRTSVIRAVQNIKQCKKLGDAAADLRAAAKQRTGLVTRLSELDTGALPDSAELNSALTEAWKASARADNAYARWADQVAGRKGCHKGTPRSTGQQAAGNRASGEATRAKKRAAGLWNPTARKYGLPERRITQL
ncbi:hypothetical protein [Streptomyces sp. JJ36]|uniref:hypothetical protein n=1 Tax=Streptomyces sp. JJ36 TaxID=2736645 RepID=UPI001F18C1EF|nr:hypothetical protein [Streptomyces sp. JJ36]MCF6525934.1 hypothetical protein [Streptomyces sp. JJ36]